MLKVIVQQSRKLVAFLANLKLELYQPQIRHLTQLLDALLVCNTTKTLTNLYRQIEGDPDPKNAADFFRESTWSVHAISNARKPFLLTVLLEAAKQLNLDLPLLVSLLIGTGQISEMISTTFLFRQVSC